MEMEIRAMLGIPRPRTRGECLEEARPCPWVGCRDHLLLDLAPPLRSGQPPGLMLNVKGTARRRRLSSSADASEVDTWTDRAVSTLMVMTDTCARDIAKRGALTTAEVGRKLGVTKEQARVELIAARTKAMQAGGDALAELAEDD